MLCWISFVKTPEQSVINTVTVLCGQEAGACCWDVKHSIPTNATGRAPLPCILLIPGPTATLLLSLSGNEMYFYTEGIYSARYISVSQPCSSNCIWDENTVKQQGWVQEGQEQTWFICQSRRLFFCSNFAWNWIYSYQDERMKHFGGVGNLPPISIGRTCRRWR